MSGSFILPSSRHWGVAYSQDSLIVSDIVFVPLLLLTFRAWLQSKTKRGNHLWKLPTNMNNSSGASFSRGSNKMYPCGQWQAWTSLSGLHCLVTLNRKHHNSLPLQMWFLYVMVWPNQQMSCKYSLCAWYYSLPLLWSHRSTGRWKIGTEGTLTAI